MLGRRGFSIESVYEERSPLLKRISVLFFFSYLSLWPCSRFPHRVVYPRVWVLGRRGFSIESVYEERSPLLKRISVLFFFSYLSLWPCSRFPHRVVYPRVWVLGRRGFAIESAAIRLCREGVARVATDVMLRDLDFQCLLHEVGGGWRSSLTEAPMSLWTPYWSLRCNAMVQRAQVLLTQMEMFWHWFGRRKECTLP